MDPVNMIDGDSYYYFWFDTYPMEFAVFLLDSALARGTYYHTMCANDAFYERSSGEEEGGTIIGLGIPSVNVQFLCFPIGNRTTCRSTKRNVQGRRKQVDIGGGGAGNSRNLGGSGGRHTQIILKSRTPEIRFPAFWEVIFYRKAHYKLEVWERVHQD